MKKFLKQLQHYLEYVVLKAIVGCLRFNNIDRSANICSFIARKIGPLLPVNNIARKNIANALGNDADSKQLIIDLWDNFGRFIGEFPFVQSMTQEEMDRRVKIIGLENILELKQRNQPYLLFLGHLANWEFLSKVINQFYPRWGIVYRIASNSCINKFINKQRNSRDIRFIAKGKTGVRDLIKSIKTKESIAMFVDQKMNEGIKVPFFGLSAMTAHGIAKLALQLKYPIVPCQFVRTKGSYFEVIIHKPLEYSQSSDEDQDCYNIMLNINQILEDWILQHPEQWLWFHNRWGKYKNGKLEL